MRVCYRFFSLDSKMSNRIHLFVSSKNQASCNRFLQLELEIWLIIPDVSLIFHCVKSVEYGVISGPYYPVFGPNTGKYGPKITP